MEDREVLHFHFCCGGGGSAKGINMGSGEVNGLRGNPRCIGGIDSDPASLRDFEHATGVKGTLLDLFDREQYTAFHGHEPPPDWREATVPDIHRAAGYERPHIVFISAPCKGLSGLLSESRSQSAKYQALNRLTLRCVWLMCEAWGDDPPELIAFENVPRIVSRGAHLVDQIRSVLSSYGYAVVTPDKYVHDCGELGGLAQSRKRFLLIARHTAKVPPYLYEAPKRPLRAVGEVIGRLPLPGDPRGGPMHRIPNLQWKTWVRLAFVEAGSDWRSLNKLKVVDGKLADYLLVPEYRNDCYGVNAWDGPMGTVTGDARPMKGKFAVADPRFEGHEYGQYGVRSWDKPTGAVSAGTMPGQGGFSVADPRIDGVRHNNVLRVADWESHSPSVTGGSQPSSGGLCVADPRPGYIDAHKNVFRIINWDEHSQTVSSGHGPSSGGMCVADPRFPNSQGEHGTKYHVQSWDEPSKTITGSDRIGSGALCIADPRCGMKRGKGDNYLTAGQYGVIPWDQACGAVSSSAGHDSGRWNVADPRLPEANEKGQWFIRAIDGTWHRPFTTLDLACLQSYIDPDELIQPDGTIFDMDGNSDSAKRERIGNMVPPLAAKALADTMIHTLLLAWSGQSFALSSTSIWVRPYAIAMSIDIPEVR